MDIEAARILTSDESTDARAYAICFHAHYEGDEALVKIPTLSVIAGTLSPRAMGLVAE